MANAGKFIDRLPIICPAGISSEVDVPIKSLLKQYNTKDYLEYIYDQKLKEERQNNVNKYTKSQKPREFEGIESCICPRPKTKFQQFHDKVYDAKYESFRNRPLGKSRQPTAKPDNINNLNTTFGVKAAQSETLYDLVLPKKIPFQVFYEAEEAHDLYLKSHQQYFPAERVNRKYLSPPFNEKHTFGNQSNIVPDGKLVRQALEDIWYPEYFCISNKTQCDYLDRYRSTLGKPLQPNKITSKLPADFTYGISTKGNCYSSEEQIYHRDPCDLKTQLYSSLKYLNSVRNLLKKRISYDVEDMYLELDAMDTKSIGVLELKNFICVMKDHRIPVDGNSLLVLLKHFKMLREGHKANIKEFMSLLDSRHPLPDLGRLDNIFLPEPPALTTYRNFTNNIYQDDPMCKVEPAGLPSHSLERELPKIHKGTIRADIDSLTEETDMRTLLMQSVPIIFGLSQRDYFQPRSKEEIREIFSNIGLDLGDNNKFEKLCCKALKHWTCKGEMISVEAFRHALHENRLCEKNL